MQQFLDVPVAERKAVVQPHGVLDDRHWETVAVGLGVGHGRSAYPGPVKATQPLEQQFDNPAAGQHRILQVSQGFTYTWDNSKSKGEKVSALVLNGTPIDPATTYRVAVNNFLADGGDGFTTFRQGKDLIGGDLDIDAFRSYLQSSTISAPAVGRITRLD
ncbi:hypothetical protein E7T06_14610 [Deinococcus sp. Arct2-2]|nr:hypothetical protein E7T06_14610 [Deinococcus sp. Arct2-2]